MTTKVKTTANKKGKIKKRETWQLTWNAIEKPTGHTFFLGTAGVKARDQSSPSGS